MSKSAFVHKDRFFRCTWCGKSFFGRRYRHPNAYSFTQRMELCLGCYEAARAQPERSGYKAHRTLTRTVYAEAGVDVPTEYEGSPSLF